ncbi:MAG: HigA family addiction module antidote protein [Deltaproteobacteria bacterium]|nr:HigA family addiction module antidote protein [Deltaproteobacteria bacterium]
MPKSKKRLPNIHPGEILDEEFLRPLGVSQYRLAKDIGVPQTRISAILKKRRSISTDTALRLAKYFGTTAHFWLNLQIEYDLEEIQKDGKLELAEIKPGNFEQETTSPF